MRLLGIIAVVGVLLGLVFGGWPQADRGHDSEAARSATFVVVRDGIEYRSTEPADIWEIQPDGRTLVRTPEDGTPTEFYATTTADRADASVTFLRDGGSVTMHLVKLDTALP